MALPVMVVVQVFYFARVFLPVTFFLAAAGFLLAVADFPFTDFFFATVLVAFFLVTFF